MLAQAAFVTYLAVVPGVTWDHDASSVNAAAVVAPTCVADVWLTLGAGERATVPSCEAPVVTPTATGAVVEGWSALVERNDGARLGALVEALSREGLCVGADGPYAALAAADPSGRVAEYRAASPECAVQFVERVVPEGDRRVVSVYVPREKRHLGAVTVSGVKPGTLSGTPKRPGLLTLPDVTRLLAPVGAGTDPEIVDGGDPRDLDRLANARQRYNGFWVAGLISFPLLLLIAYGVRRRVPPGLALVAASYAPAGFAVGLVPWWRWGAAGAALAVAGATLALAGVSALAGRSLRVPELGLPVVVVTAFVLDLVDGQRLMRDGIASYSMLVGGRFFGLGNLAFAILATAVAIVAGAATLRWGRRVWVAAFAALAVVVAVPGADFGGVIAVFAAGAAAVSRRLRSVVAAAVVGLGAALGVAYADAQRDGSMTHLGRFVSDGDAVATVARKGGAALHSLYATAWPLLAVGAGVAAYLLARRLPELRDTARVLAVLWVVGSLVNDSGVVVAGGGAALAAPLLLAYRARRA